MKQVASPGALKQVKLIASELRASPPNNEASGFGASRFKTEAFLSHHWRTIHLSKICKDLELRASV